MLAGNSAQNDKGPRKGIDPEVFVRAIAERVANASGLDLVDIEMKRGGKGPLVRVFLDKPGRISLDELESASREISVILDVEDPIGRSYTLEVSSPGMTRPLRTPADFERVLQKNIQISFLAGAPPNALYRRAQEPGEALPDLLGSTSGPRGEELRDEVSGSVREVKGRLLAVSDKEVRIVPRDNKGREGAEICVPLSALCHAQREISFR